MHVARSPTAEATIECSETAVRAQLDRILKSEPFHRSQRRQRFLQYIVDETLAGRGDRIKGYTIALAVFERPSTFDANIDPTVRMEAGRLRDKLREYYDGEGQADDVRIELPKGSYTPKIELRAAEPTGKVESNQPFTAGWRTLAALRGKKLAQVAALAAVALMICAAGISWMKEPLVISLDRPSIAVLPFDNIGGDTQWTRFADGITEDIITDLAQTKDLLVIARNSTEGYKGKPIDVRKIGRDLAVKYVLEGSIQPVGERIRVTAQLIETVSGSHVWSERYDRPADGLFAVQNDVTQRISATLAGYEGAVAQAERSGLRRKPPANLTAYDTYLLGMEAKHKVTKDGLIEAERLFHKALELDPQLARAHVGLVDVQFYLIDLGLAPSVAEALSKMMTAGEMAASLDPNDGKTHYALGLASLYNGKQEQAAAEFVRAETLSPSDADMLVCIGWSIPALGESERAGRLMERALMLNPHYPAWYDQGLSYVYFFNRKFDASVKHRLLVKRPMALDYAFLAMAYAYLGRSGDSTAAAGNVTKLDPHWTAESYLSEAGGYEESAAELVAEGARKAGLPACVPAEKVKDTPSLIHIKSCDRQRAKISG